MIYNTDIQQDGLFRPYLGQVKGQGVG